MMFPPLSLSCRALGAVLALTASASLHAGLVVHLRFDEGEGVVARNKADTSAPGVFSVTGAEWTTDVPETFVSRTAYRNTGNEGAYVSVKGDSEGISTFDDFTITGWVQATEVNGTAGAFDRILSKRDAVGQRAIDIGFINSGSGSKAGIGIGVLVGSLNQVVTPPIDFSEGWIFFAVTRVRDTGEISIYLGRSGREQSAQLERTGEGTPGPIKNNAPLMVGNTPMGVHRAGEASYSDIRIYNEVLDAAQIEAVRQENLSSR